MDISYLKSCFFHVNISPKIVQWTKLSRAHCVGTCGESKVLET